MPSLHRNSVPEVLDVEGASSFRYQDLPFPPTASFQGGDPLSRELLLVGQDVSLQETRKSLLERVGFQCNLCAGAAEAANLPGIQFRVAVLCHTVAVAEALRIMAGVLLQSPSTSILRLAKYPQREDACFSNVLVAPSPHRFVMTVEQLSFPGRRSV